jgi:hypothetical protein
MPLTSPAGFTTIHGMTDGSGMNPSSNATYYSGAFLIFDVDASYASHAIYAAQTCRVVAMRSLFINAGNPGSPSTHRVTYAIRVNDTSDFTIGTTQDWKASTTTVFSGLSIPLVQGQTYAIKISTPAWSTNPTTIFNSLQLWYEIP